LIGFVLLAEGRIIVCPVSSITGFLVCCNYCNLVTVESFDDYAARMFQFDGAVIYI